ncbi:TPA: hypothetical protein SMR48_002736 [Pseudomonas putida]|nr:hypothetical protein [Pseudomonas putida]
MSKYKVTRVVKSPLTGFETHPYVIADPTNPNSSQHRLGDYSLGNGSSYEPLLDKNFIYDPSDTTALLGDLGSSVVAKRQHKTFVLPVISHKLAPGSVVELGEKIRKLRIVVIVKSSAIPAHIYGSNFMLLPLEFYISHDNTINEIFAPIIKSLRGQGVFKERIAKTKWDKIDSEAAKMKAANKENDRIMWMRGSSLPGHGIPWSIKNTDQGRSLNRSKTYDGNSIADDEVIVCTLYRPGNGMTSYGGAGKFDTKTFWTDTLADMFVDIVSSAV